MGWHALIIHTRGFDYQGLHLLHDKQGLVANHCANTFKLILMTCSAWKISLDTQSDWQFSYRSQCLLPIPKLRLSSTATNWWGMVAWQPCWSTMVSKAWVLWHLRRGHRSHHQQRNTSKRLQRRWMEEWIWVLVCKRTSSVCISKPLQ